jgi:hypothetical protein
VVTAVLQLATGAIILTGGRIIFVMAVAAAPLALCLLFRRLWDSAARATGSRFSVSVPSTQRPPDPTGSEPGRAQGMLQDLPRRSVARRG